MTSTNGNPYYQARTMNGIFNVTDGQYSLAQIGYDTQAIHYENATNTTVIDNTLEATDIIVDTTLTLPSGQVINSATSFLTSTDNITVTGYWDFSNNVIFPNNQQITSTSGNFLLENNNATVTGNWYFPNQVILPNNQTITPASGNFLLENNDATVTGNWYFPNQVILPNSQTITPASGNFLTENANATINGTWDFTTNITLPNNQNITTGTGYLLVNNVNETVTGDYHFNNTIRFPNNQIVYTTTGDFLLDDIDQTITGNNTFTGNTILGNTTIGSLTVTGNTILGNTITGDTTIGNLTVTNNTILNTVTTNDITCNGDIYFDGEIIKPDPTGKSLGSFVYSSNQLAYQSLFSFDSVIFPSVGDFVISNTLGIPSGQSGNKIASINTVNKIISFTPASNLPIATPFATQNGYNANTTEIFFYNTFSPTVLGKGIRSSQTTANNPYVNTLFNTDYGKVTTTAITPQTGITNNYYVKTGALLISGESTSTIVSDISENTYLNKFIEINGFTNNPSVVTSYIFSQDPTNGFIYTMKSRKAIASKISNSTFTGIITSPTTLFYSSFSPSVPPIPSDYFIEPITLGTGSLIGTTCSAINTGTRTVTVTTQPLVVQPLDIIDISGIIDSTNTIMVDDSTGISANDYIFNAGIPVNGSAYITSVNGNYLPLGLNTMTPTPLSASRLSWIFQIGADYYISTFSIGGGDVFLNMYVKGDNMNPSSKLTTINDSYQRYKLSSANSVSAISATATGAIVTSSATRMEMYYSSKTGTLAQYQGTSFAGTTDIPSMMIDVPTNGLAQASISLFRYPTILPVLLYDGAGSGFTYYSVGCYCSSTTKIALDKTQMSNIAVGHIMFPRITPTFGTLNGRYVASLINTTLESSVTIPVYSGSPVNTTATATATLNAYLRSATQLVLPSGITFTNPTTSMIIGSNGSGVGFATHTINRIGTTQTYTIMDGVMGTSNPTTLQLYITPSLNKAVFTATPTVGLFIEGSGILEGTSVSSTVSQYATLSVSQSSATTPSSTINKGAVYLISSIYYLVYTGSTLTVGDYVIGTGMAESSVIRISTAQPTRTNVLTYQTTAPTAGANILSSGLTCMFFGNWVYIAFTAVVSAFTLPNITFIFASTTVGGTIYDGKIATDYSLESGTAKRIQRFDLVSGLPDTPVTCSGTPTNGTGTITVLQFPSGSGTGRPTPFPNVGQFYGFGSTIGNRTSLTVTSINGSAGTVTLSASFNYTAGTTVGFFDPQYTNIKILSTNSFSTYTPYNVSAYKNTTVSQFTKQTIDIIVPKTYSFSNSVNRSFYNPTAFSIKKAKTYDMIPKATGTVYTPISTSFYNTEDVTYNKLNSITLPDTGGEMVLTTAFQTLTNKILTSPVINTPTINTPTISSATISSSTINTTTLNTPTINTPVISTATISGSTLTTSTLTSPSISNPTITTQLTLTNGLSCNFYIGTIQAQIGYLCKAGTNGGYSNVFNWFWTGSSLQAWIDVTNVGTVCDYRIKENIKPTLPVLDRLCGIQMFDYTHKNISICRNNGNHIGLFAHELQEIFNEYPCLVTGEKDEEHENGEIKIQSIEMPILNMILMKSIQEQNDIIKSQQNQIDLLTNQMQEINQKIKLMVN